MIAGDPIPIGLAVACPGDGGRLYVYLGYRVTSAGTRSRLFVRALAAGDRTPTPWTYVASNERTMISKFPALAAYLKE